MTNLRPVKVEMFKPIQGRQNSEVPSVDGMTSGQIKVYKQATGPRYGQDDRSVHHVAVSHEQMGEACTTSVNKSAKDDAPTTAIIATKGKVQVTEQGTSRQKKLEGTITNQVEQVAELKPPIEEGVACHFSEKTTDLTASDQAVKIKMKEEVK